MPRRRPNRLALKIAAGLLMAGAVDASAQTAGDMPVFLSDKAPVVTPPVSAPPASAPAAAPATAPAPAAAPVPAAAPPAAAAPAPALSAEASAQLLEQVGFWRQRGRRDMAQKAVDQILAIDPNNLDALFQAGLIAAESGDAEAGNRYRSRLMALAPEDPRGERLRLAIQRGRIPVELVNQARAQAQAGKTEEAARLYQQAFSNLPPPSEYAFEYYMTLAGTERGWPTARDGLASLARRAPDDAGLQVAYGQMLTYREVGRREGIALLSRYAAGDEAARKYWRQGLLWLNASPADAGLYEAYLNTYPDDAEVAAAYKTLTAPMLPDTPERAVSLGYAALADKKTAQAEEYFLTALRLDPANANALASLATLRLRQGRAGDALDLLKKAVAAAPDRREEFAEAYESAVFTVSYQAAVAAQKARRFARAEELLRPLAYGHSKDRRIALALLGDVLAAQGKDAEAEKAYRQVLQGNPRDRQALTGLYGILLRQNKTAEARALVDRIPAADRARLESSLDAAAAAGYRSEAEALASGGRADDAAATYQKALAADPGNPWVRLSYARFLLRQGDAAQAQGLIAPLATAAPPSADGLYASALFAVDQKRFAEAAALIERIPARERTPAMVAFSREISLRGAIAQARASFDAGNRGQALASMRALAARSDLSPATRGEIASTLYEMGDGSGALAIVRAELAKGIPASAQVADYAAMASVLTRAGSDAEAGALVTRLDTLARGASDRRALQDLRNGLAAQRADRLRLAEQLAPAYDVLAAALQSDPEDPVLLGSLARLYAAGDMHGEATAIYDRLLARSPGSVDLTLQAANVAIGGRDFDRAHALLDPVLASSQAGAQAYFMAGQLARAEGDTAGAIDALEQAQALRAKELGVASAVGGGLPAAAPAAPLLGPNPFRSDTAPALPPASPVAAAAPLYLPGAATATASAETPAPGASSGQTAINDYGTPPVPVPVYRPGAAPVPAPVLPRQVAMAGTGTMLTADPLSRDIDSALVAVRREVAPVAYTDFGFRYRDGEIGMSRLTQIDNATSFTFSPGNTGRLKLEANPVHVDAGTPTFGGARRFGTNPVRLPTRPVNPGNQSDTGIGLSASYSIADLKLDIGTTPLGFQIEHMQGGIQWEPALTDHLRLRLTADRRPVTDSVLSYAGTRDPVSGKEWGAVMRTGGEVGLYYDQAEGGAYGALGYHVYRGTRVSDNAAWNAAFGAYVRPYRTETSQLQVGLALNYLNFDKNLGQFTLGHGGYFSPQNYYSIAVPVDYKTKLNKWSFDLGAAVGYQNFRQEAAPYFPDDPSLQAGVEAAAAANPSHDIPTAYAESSESGFGGSVRAAFEYELTPETTVGGSIGASSFGDYDEASGRVFLRYNFSE